MLFEITDLVNCFKTNSNMAGIGRRHPRIPRDDSARYIDVASEDGMSPV